MDTVITLLKSISTVARSVILEENTEGNYSTHPLTFIKDVDWLNKNWYTQCDPSDVDKFPDCVSSVEWTDKLISCHSRRTTLNFQDVSTSTKSLMHQYNKILSEMYIWHNTVNKSPRNKPFNVVLTGHSQSGKTSFIAPCLSQIALTELGYKCDSIFDHFRIINPSDPYMSDYNVNTDKTVVVDEFNNYNDDKTKNKKDVVVENFLQMLSNGQFTLHSAHLEEKGRRQFRPDCIFILSNEDDLGMNSFLKNPEAGWNRIDVKYEVVIREKFRLRDEQNNPIGGINISVLLDHQNLLLDEHGEEAKKLNDYYPTEFKIYKKTLNKFIDSGETLGFMDLCISFRESVRKHKDRLKKDQALNKTNVLDFLPPSGIELSPTSYSSFIFNDKLRNGLDVPSIGSITFVYINLLFLKILVFFAQLFPNFFKSYIDRRARDQIALQFELSLMHIIRNSKNFTTSINKAILDYTEQDIKLKLAKYATITLGIGAVVALLKNYIRSDIVTKHDPVGLFTSREEKPPNNILGRIPSQYQGSNNIYGKVDERISYPRASSSPIDILRDKIDRNLYKLSINSVNEIVCNIINIHDCYYLAPLHNFKDLPKDSMFDLIQYIPTDDFISENVIFSASINSIKWVPISVDTCLVKIIQQAPGPSLLKYLMNDFGSLNKFQGFNTYLSNNNRLIEDPFEGNFAQIKYRKSLSTSVEPTLSSVILGKTKTPSVFGRCGSPLISIFGKQIAIVGIIVAGSPGDFYNAAEPLLLKDIQNGIKKLNSSLLVPTSSVSLEESHSLKSFKGNFGINSKKNHSFWLKLDEIKNLRFLCSLSVNTVNPRSKVFRLKTYHSFFNEFPLEFHHTLVEPNFRSYVDNYGEYFGVFKNMLLQSNSHTHNINLDHLEIVIDQLVSKFLKVKDFENLEIWDIDHSISGASSSLCKAMPKTTGAGFPFNCKKIDLLVDSESIYAPDGKIPNESFRSEILECIDLMKQGIRPMFVNKCCIKDEPRDKIKVSKRLIRVFTCAPFNSVTIQKMMCGSFTNIFTSNFLQTETVGGINCYSEDWGKVYSQLQIHPNCINGDFSKYDKKASSVMICGAFSVMFNVIDKVLKVDDEVRNVFKVIMSEIAHPIMLVDKELLAFNGSLSSGVYLTFLLNNIMNSLYIRLAWLSIIDLPASESLQEFENNVVFFAMGDDNTFTVSDKYISKFNFESIHLYFKSIGIKYTNAAKTDEMYGSVPVTEATICKRKFVYDDKIKFTLCPIEKPSIGKMLTMALQDGPLTEDQKIKESCVSAIYEFFQYGKQEYDLCMSRLKRMMFNVGLELNHYPTYEEMYKKIILCKENPWTSDFNIIQGNSIVMEPTSVIKKAIDSVVRSTTTSFEDRVLALIGGETVSSVKQRVDRAVVADYDRINALEQILSEFEGINILPSHIILIMYELHLWEELMYDFGDI